MERPLAVEMLVVPYSSRTRVPGVQYFAPGKPAFMRWWPRSAAPAPKIGSAVYRQVPEQCKKRQRFA